MLGSPKSILVVPFRPTVPCRCTRYMTTNVYEVTTFSDVKPNITLNMCDGIRQPRNMLMIHIISAVRTLVHGIRR